MLYNYDVSKLMLIDGIIFMIQGIGLILFPGPQKRLYFKLDVKSVLPVFKDVRVMLGAGYTSMGLIVAALGGIIHHPDELNSFAIFRCLSMIFIIYAVIMQISGKRWKWRPDVILYLAFYSILFILYAFYGFIFPMPLSN